MRRHFKIRPWVIITVSLFAIAILLVNRYVCSFFRVSGDSMVPTLQNGDLCLVWKIGAPRQNRGDIVFMRTPDDPPVYYVKRIIALPGETINIDDGQTYIDGRPLEESYTKPNKTWGLRITILPQGYYYFIGDHRAVVIENHGQGSVSDHNIQGRVIAHWSF